MAILVHCVIGHVHVSLSNGLTFDTAEVNHFFLRVVLDNLDDREPINTGEVGISTFLIDKKKQATEDYLV